MDLARVVRAIWPPAKTISFTFTYTSKDFVYKSVAGEHEMADEFGVGMAEFS